MVIQLNSNIFEMDIRGLAMAFFPGQELQVVLGEGQQMQNDCLHIVQNPKWLAITYLEDGQILAEEAEPVTEEDHKLQRDQLKRMMYRVLKKGLGKELPWGTLSGIRPVKIARTALEHQFSEDEIRQELENVYYISPKKRDLMMDIAKTELEVLSGIPYKDGYSLYVGIPFCPSTCAYCSFTSYPIHAWKDQVDHYLDLLCKEITYTADLFQDKKLCTIYVGGGTPTTLNPSQLARLLDKLCQISSKEPLYEMTVEAGRPDSVTQEKLQVLKDYGVTRISVNPQTMNQETLNRIGRAHTVEQTIEAYKMARNLGFDNINMDLIMGLPGETREDVEKTMDQIQQLRPDSLTVHSLAIKRAARLNTAKEDYQQYESVNTQEMIDMVRGYAEEMDLIPYYLYRQKNMTGNLENVGYAKRNKIGIYNILIMEEMQTIAAVGAGGATKVVDLSQNLIQRAENVKEVRSYMTRFEEMLERKQKLIEN